MAGALRGWRRSLKCDCRGCLCRFEQRRAILDECDADLVRARTHGDARFQILVQHRGVGAGGLLDREVRDRLPVDEHHQLVRTRLPQPADVSFQIAREPDLDLVLAVLGECVGHRHPAARAQGQAGQMIFLREVGRQANDVALERRLRAADRQAADFLRGRDVAVQERRRQVADRDVVEAVTALIGWQERGGVDVERQQVSDGVLILGPIQAAERVRAAGIRSGGGRRIERCFQPCQQRAPVVLGRLRHVGRRHGARVHLAHHLFPDFGVSTGVGDVEPVQPQVRSLEPFVVARDAVPIEQTTGARRGRDRSGRADGGSPPAADLPAVQTFALAGTHTGSQPLRRTQASHSGEREQLRHVTPARDGLRF